MNTLFIPKIDFEQLDERAYWASRLGTAVGYIMLLSWCMAIPFIFLKNFHAQLLRINHELPTIATFALIPVGAIISLGLALFTKKMIGGQRFELSNVPAEFSQEFIKIGDNLSVPTDDIRKARVAKYKHGCIEVSVRMKDGGQIRIRPTTVSEHLGIEIQRTKYCELCEIIRSRLSP